MNRLLLVWILLISASPLYAPRVNSQILPSYVSEQLVENVARSKRRLIVTITRLLAIWITNARLRFAPGAEQEQSIGLLQ